MEIEKAKEIIKEHLESQIDPENTKVCLDAVHLLTTWKITPSNLEDLQEAEAIIAYSFGIGKRKDGKPEIQEPFKIKYDPLIHFSGLTNEDLAKVIADLHPKLKIPIFAQIEIAQALEENHQIKLDEQNIAKPKQDFLSTHGVIQQFLENGLKDFSKIIIIAHPMHILRAKAITNTELFNKNKKYFEKIFIADTSQARYDPDSLQPWTKNEKNFLKHEMGSRIYHTFYTDNLNPDLFKK